MVVGGHRSAEDGFDFISDPDNAADGDGIDPNADDTGDGGFGRSSSFHGTHVASTIAEGTDNARGLTGLAFQCAIMPVKVLDEDGTGTFFDVAEGIDYAADYGQGDEQPVKVINMSSLVDDAAAGDELPADAVPADYRLAMLIAVGRVLLRYDPAFSRYKRENGSRLSDNAPSSDSMCQLWGFARCPDDIYR